jgi:hypothetical protein
MLGSAPRLQNRGPVETRVGLALHAPATAAVKLTNPHQLPRYLVRHGAKLAGPARKGALPAVMPHGGPENA